MSPDQISTLETRLYGKGTNDLYVDPEVVRKLMAAYRKQERIAAAAQNALKTILQFRCEELQVHVIQDIARRVMAEILGRMEQRKTEGPTQ